MAYNITANDGYDCDVGTHDDCLDQHRMLLKTNCSLPFELGQTIDEPVCQTYEEGVEVVKEILASRNKCKSSCLQIDVRYKEEPDHYLLALANPKANKKFVEFSGKNLGYTYNIPNKVKLLSNVHEYTAQAALGYFGSIVGVFIGVSIFGILEIIAVVLDIKHQVRKCILNAAKLIMIIYLLCIFGMLLMKYIHRPVANSISFVKSKSDFSLTVCSIPYYNYKNINDTERYTHMDSNYKIDSISFWEKWISISTMIDTMTINNGTHEINLISDKYENTRHLTILPYNNISLAICHTFDLSQHNSIHTLNLVYNSEIEIFVHKQGQFLHEWIRKGTKILPSSKENVRKKKNIIEISNTAFFLDMEIISKLHGSSTTESFDVCLKNEGKKLLGNEFIQCFLDIKNSTKCFELIHYESLKNMTNFINHQEICNSQETDISIKTSQYNYAKSKIIKVRNTFSNDLFKENIGLTNKKIGVSLIFSSFTRISKVRFLLKEKKYYYSTYIFLPLIHMTILCISLITFSIIFHGNK